MTTFYPVVDELVPVNKFRFRIRMWRQAGFPPLVLYTQVPGQPPPKHFSSYLGNLVLRGLLGYALPIPVFFELTGRAKRPGRSGSVTQRWLQLSADPSQPDFTPLNPSAVEKLFGGKLDEPAVQCVSDERRRLENYGTGRRLSERRPLEASRA